MFKEKVGKRIKELREIKCGLNQKNFSKKTGLDKSYISIVEAGKQNITLTTLENICFALGVSLMEFFYSIDGGKQKITLLKP